jgi:PAS domain S-box-containing protein
MKVEPRKSRSGRGSSPGQTSASTSGLQHVTIELQREQIRALQDRIASLQTELRVQADRSTRMLDAQPVPYIELLANGIIRHASSDALALLGSDEKVLFQPLRVFVSPDYIERVFRHIHQCLTAAPERPHIETEIELSSAAGSKTVRLVSRPVLKTPGTAERVVPTALIDMTEARLSSRWAALEEQHFQRLVESIDGIVWEADYPFRLRFVSPQIERLLGYRPAEWAGDASFWASRIHVKDRARVLREREAAIRAGAPQVTEYRFHSADGAVVWLRDSMFISRTAHGHTRLHGLMVNITPLKQAEAELLRTNEQVAHQAEQHRRHLQDTVQSMETFCYGIAHELRAPVRAMQGFSELLLQDPATINKKDYLSRIATAAIRLDALISDLLAYGRLHHAELLVVPTAVKAVVARSVEALSTEIAQSAAVIEVVPSNARVLAHPMLLDQALQNLIANALKFVPPGARPRVEIKARAVDGHTVRIAVSDNGIGVNPDAREKIFGIFQRGYSQDEYPGTGIGLAMVKRIVELLNGRIGVDDLPPHGSSFWIELPKAPPEAVAEPTP